MLSAFSHAPTLCYFSGSSLTPASKSNLVRAFSMTTSARIAVVGDIHGDWNLQEDEKALEFLKPDLVLFTGDFGEENVELVRSIAEVKFPKAVILGNHDAWFTRKFSEKIKDGVQLQLECLGEDHVAYRRLDFPLLKLSIIGGRPFSNGGQYMFRNKLLSSRYGVQTMEASAKRIYEAALGTPEDHVIVCLAHNGPIGLGSNLDDICGVDWLPRGGDHGDRDLAQAISLLKETGKYHIPLVVFGHMHKELAAGNGHRKMILVSSSNTIYLNGAVVPRVNNIIDTQGPSSEELVGGLGTKRAFTIVDVVDGKVAKVAEIWVSVLGSNVSLEQEHVLFVSGS